jgi:mono/diheme cytochrome c family protein
MLMHRLAAAASVLALLIPLANAQQGGDPQSGFNIAKSVCATCHAVRKGDSLSPRPGASSFEEIANASGVTGISLAATLHSIHENMPNFVLPVKNRDDIIAYILTLKHER